MTPRSIRLLCSSVLVVLAAIALEAGGWAVITVKDLPDYVVVGKPVTLTYAVRQHGQQLLGGLDGRLEMRSDARLVRTAATATSETGYYSATFTLPYAGDWTINIVSGFAGGLSSSRIRMQAIESPGRVPLVSEAERGQRLFTGKGCVTCHVHASVASGFVPIGPELTARRYQPEYLKRFLANPTQTPSAKFGSQMPNLDLRDTEITSLVAFINAEPSERLTVAER